MESDRLRPKEPVKAALHLKTSALEKDDRDLIRGLVEKCNSRLWHYSEFPIRLPEPITLAGKSQSLINIDQLLVKPNFNELREVSQDDHGRPRRLTFEQLDSVRARGEFDVRSKRFEGVSHKWLLTQILVKGTEKTRETMELGFAKALHFLVSLSRKFIVDEGFSLFASINGWTQGIMGILDSIFGMPLTRTTMAARTKLERERTRYLVAELICSSSKMKEGLVSFITESMQSSYLKTDIEQSQMPKIPYLFKKPGGQVIDLRLHNRDLMRRATPHLRRILDNMMSGWFVERKHTMFAELQKEGVADKDIEKMANERISTEYLERVADALLNDKGVKALGPGVAELLIKQVRTSAVVAKVRADFSVEYEDQKETMDRELQKEHPVLYKVEDWRHRHMRTIMRDFSAKNEWVTHERVIEKCREMGLNQSAYFFDRELSFRQNLLGVLASELRNLKEPSLEFKFTYNIWLPQNWKISKKLSDNTWKYIPTEIFDGIHMSEHHGEYERTKDGSTPEYKLERVHSANNSTKYPAWRWTNFFLRTSSWLWNSVYFFGAIIPFVSAVSFRALFSLTAYYPDYELCVKSGRLKQNLSHKVNTVASRLSSVWTHVRQARNSFEAAPDTGLLPKTISRIINRFVNYFLKGFVGTAFIILVFPTSMLLISFFSLAVAVTAPVWVVAGSVLIHVISAVILDFDGPSRFGAILWNLLINIFGRGIVQPIVSLLLAMVFAPLMAALLSVFAVTRKFVRGAWDRIMFNLILKRFARIPDRDSFLAKRISGPGLASKYFYQIRPEQALVAISSEIEKTELDVYAKQTKEEIDLPLKELKSVLTPILAPFGAKLTADIDGPSRQLLKEESEFKRQLNQEIEKRIRLLTKNGDKDMFRKVRLDDSDLGAVLQRGTLLARDLYERRILSRLSEQEKKEFWEEKGLLESDYRGLVSQHLSNFFSPGFLTPLQATDTTFQLKVEHWNLDRYTDMLTDAKWRDDLDAARPINVEKLEMRVRQPDMDAEDFDPVHFGNTCPSFHHDEDLRWLSSLFVEEEERSSCGAIYGRRWNVYKGDSRRKLNNVCLVHPLPVPHPANISLVIHKRNDENIGGAAEQLDLDDAALINILDRWTSNDTISARYEEYNDEEKEEAGGSFDGWSDGTERAEADKSPVPNE